ncbi:unnamed protein product [marine sediment metagenome]|uniref:Peptidase M15C domain-containing protein n=1 Tax=marine sediment metagenome TaxID=412755 RepID=X0T7L0_9ZZZZ
MTLGEKQRLFTKLIARLIQYAYENGFELSFGDAYRDARVHGPLGRKVGYSSAQSNHKRRLACDLNLFIDGIYQTQTAAYTDLGNYWRGLHDLCEWGGEGSRSDGNHFSMNHEGRW